MMVLFSILKKFFIIPILPMKLLRPGEMKYFAQGLTGNKQQILDSTPGIHFPQETSMTFLYLKCPETSTVSMKVTLQTQDTSPEDIH